MKPFDLKAAMAGEPVVTRDGRAFTFGAYNPEAHPGQQVLGWVEQRMTACYERGTYLASDESDLDLFMAPKKVQRTVWINIYADQERDVVHSSREEADTCARLNRITCVEVTYEFEV